MTGVDLEEAMALLRRAPVLEACRDEPTSRRELAGRADLSRSTVYRATTDLFERGLLVESRDGYRTTPRGRALLAATDDLLAGIETIERLGPLFDVVSHPELLEHAHLLSDANVVVADASNPYRVVDRVIERFDETDRSRGTIASATSAEAMKRATSSIDDKHSIERIFAADAIDAHEAFGGATFREVMASDVLSVLVADDDAIPFSFAIDDEDVAIAGHDPATGLPTVHVESEQPAVRGWLERIYEQCREEATPVSDVP